MGADACHRLRRGVKRDMRLASEQRRWPDVLERGSTVPVGLLAEACFQRIVQS